MLLRASVQHMHWKGWTEAAAFKKPGLSHLKKSFIICHDDDEEVHCLEQSCCQTLFSEKPSASCFWCEANDFPGFADAGCPFPGAPQAAGCAPLIGASLASAQQHRASADSAASLLET